MRPVEGTGLAEAPLVSAQTDHLERNGPSWQTCVSAVCRATGKPKMVRRRRVEATDKPRWEQLALFAYHEARDGFSAY